MNPIKLLKAINNYQYPQWVINVIATFVVIFFMGIVGTVWYIQFDFEQQMVEKIMAIPSDGRLDTIGQ